MVSVTSKRAIVRQATSRGEGFIPCLEAQSKPLNIKDFESIWVRCAAGSVRRPPAGQFSSVW